MRERGIELELAAIAATLPFFETAPAQENGGVSRWTAAARLRGSHNDLRLVATARLWRDAGRLTRG